MYLLFLYIGLLSFTDCTVQNVPAQQGSGDTAPTVTTQSKVYQVKLGSRLEITCTSTGSPTPTLHWTRRMLSRTVQSVVNTTKSTNKGLQLVISKISSEHEGPYYCLAVNRAGTSRMVSYVDVKPSGSPKPPILIPLQKRIMAALDGAAILLMLTENTPVGTAVYWELPKHFKPKKRVGKGTFLSQQTRLINGVQHRKDVGRTYMVIKDVYMADMGTFRCRVVTPWGLTATQEVVLFPVLTDFGTPSSFSNIYCSNTTVSKTPSLKKKSNDSAVGHEV